MLNDLSSITLLSFININIPGLPRSLIKSVMSFAQVDILPSELILQSMFTFDDINDKPFNNQFALLGYESSNGAKSMGSAFLYFVLNSVLLLLLALLSLVKRFFPRVNKVHDFLKKKVLWNLFIRFFIQQFISLIFSSAINFFYVRTITSGEKLGIYSSGFVFVITVLVIPTFAWIILKKSNDPEYLEKYGTLTEGLKMNSAVSKLWTIFGLIKWLITATVLMTLANHPAIQMMLLLLLSITYQIMILIFKPFDLPSNNRLRFITELFISCYLYFYLLLSDYNQEIDSRDVQNYSSWGLLGVLGACATLNIMIYLKIAFTGCKRLAIKKC